MARHSFGALPEKIERSSLPHPSTNCWSDTFICALLHQHKNEVILVILGAIWLLQHPSPWECVADLNMIYCACAPCRYWEQLIGNRTQMHRLQVGQWAQH